MKTFKTPKGTVLPLMDIKGKDYLQVAHRLVWFREEKPDWSIGTDYLVLEQDRSVARALIKDQSGRLMATAHKSEDSKGFADHMEKAETGAIGRALAMVGFGTQFAPELDEGERLADSPVVSGRNSQGPPNSAISGASSSKPDLGANENDQGDPGAFTINWGKYKGQSLNQIDPPDLDGYCKWIVSQSIRDGKELTGKVRDLIINAELYLQSL